MYTVATFLIQHFWGNTEAMANSLGVLLLTWNQAFYRFGPFNYHRLDRAVELHLPALATFRQRDVSSYSRADDGKIRKLFQAFSTALRICEGKRKGHRSPVSVAKALHLLAPSYFPIWDDKIARAYDCHYTDNAPKNYLQFIRITKAFADELGPLLFRENRPFTKLFDEYNYAKYTKAWI